jgi:hypothetical protein
MSSVDLLNNEAEHKPLAVPAKQRVTKTFVIGNFYGAVCTLVVSELGEYHPWAVSSRGGAGMSCTVPENT